MRVIGDNPELTDEQIEPLQIEDPSQWRNVRLEMIKADNSLLKITLLRPLEWVFFEEAEVGSIIELDMPELGAAGPATVLAIEPCPEIEVGNRPLVTGTFEHTAGNVIDLQVESEREPIGTTDNHPFWSEDRQAFVDAGHLKTGESLRLADGRTTRVASIAHRSGTQTVYNLEVSGQHVYHVGESGVLVHNTYSGGGSFRGGPHSKTKLPWGDGLESHHMPAKSISKLDEEVGPAIQMHKRDHKLTSSHGGRPGSADYRAEIEDLLSQGRTRDAMAREIRDVRRAAKEGSGDAKKYNGAVREMLDYARRIGFLN